MTPRPTDEEIFAKFDRLLEQRSSESDTCCVSTDDLKKIRDAWLTERQAARDGVTTDDLHQLAFEHSDTDDAGTGYNFSMEQFDAFASAVLQSIAQPITSVSDALNFLEEWALAGNKLHGDDIQQFHATVERIAPIAKPVMTSYTKPRAFIWRRHGRDSWEYAKWIPISDEVVTDMRNRGWDVEVLYTSPQPQQAVPDGWWVAIEDPQDTNEIAMSWNAADGNNGEAAKTEANQWINEQPHPSNFSLKFVSAAPAYNGKKEK